MECYLEIEDADSLWEQIKDKVRGLKAKGSFNPDYGMQQIHISIQHGKKTLIYLTSNLIPSI